MEILEVMFNTIILDMVTASLGMRPGYPPPAADPHRGSVGRGTCGHHVYIRGVGTCTRKHTGYLTEAGAGGFLIFETLQ